MPVRRSINLQIVFALLMALTIILGLTVWWLSNDNEGDAADGMPPDTAETPGTLAGTADESSTDLKDTGDDTTENNAGDYTGSDDIGNDANADGTNDQPTVAEDPNLPSAANTPNATDTDTPTSAADIPTSTSSVPSEANDFGPPTLSSNSTVSTVGLDSVTFGMTVQQAQKAAGTLMVPTSPVSHCYHVIPHNAPEGIVFLVYNGTIERVDIIGGPITTRSGVGIGTPDDAVIRLFGDSITKSARSDGTVDLTFVPRDAGDSDFRVVFNVTDGAVRSYKSGRIPPVLTETGCD